MNIASYPAHYYVFGKGGVPHEQNCHKDLLAEQWKHTGAVHEAMKKTDPYASMHMFRHKDLEITQKYLRDFDINLSYQPEDLTF